MRIELYNFLLSIGRGSAMQTLLHLAAAPKRASRPKKKAAKLFKLQSRDADLAEYKVNIQKVAVAMRNLYRA